MTRTPGPRPVVARRPGAWRTVAVAPSLAPRSAVAERSPARHRPVDEGSAPVRGRVDDGHQAAGRRGAVDEGSATARGRVDDGYPAAGLRGAVAERSAPVRGRVDGERPAARQCGDVARDLTSAVVAVAVAEGSAPVRGRVDGERPAARQRGDVARELTPVVVAVVVDAARAPRPAVAERSPARHRPVDEGSAPVRGRVDGEHPAARHRADVARDRAQVAAVTWPAPTEVSRPGQSAVDGAARGHGELRRRRRAPGATAALAAAVVALAFAPSAHAEAPSSPAPSSNTPSAASNGAPRAPAPAGLATVLRHRDRARVAAVAACERHGRCEPLSPLAVDDATLARVLHARARAPKAAAVQRALARAVLEDALAPGSAARAARRRTLTFSERGAVFALDDVVTLLSQARRADRARILAAAQPALAEAAAVDTDERAALEHAAVRAGLSKNELLARRAGLDEASLRALVAGALAATAPLLAPVASDVTLLPDVVVATPEAPAALAAAARVSSDPLFLAAAVEAASLRGTSADDTTRRSRALVVELRASALAVLALLDDAGAAARDALASRILDDHAERLPGAGALLPPAAGGAVVDRFVAALRAPGLAQSLAGGGTLAAAAARFAAAPPLDEQGFPEAFVEVLKVLPALTDAAPQTSSTAARAVP